MVINFDFPLNIEDYVHRIGRTGRGGAHGASYTFFTKDNERLSTELVKIMEETDQHIPEKLRQIARAAGFGRQKKNNYTFARKNYGLWSPCL